MPLTQDDLEALQGLMTAQLRPMQSGLQLLQDSGKDGAQAGPNLLVTCAKGFDGPRTQTFLSPGASKFLASLRMGTEVIDLRSWQQVVKVTFSTVRVVDEVVGTPPALENSGASRLVPNTDRLARMRDCPGRSVSREAR